MLHGPGRQGTAAGNLLPFRALTALRDGSERQSPFRNRRRGLLFENLSKRTDYGICFSCDSFRRPERMPALGAGRRDRQPAPHRLRLGLSKKMKFENHLYFRIMYLFGGIL